MQEGDGVKNNRWFGNKSNRSLQCFLLVKKVGKCYNIENKGNYEGLRQEFDEIS